MIRLGLLTALRYIAKNMKNRYLVSYLLVFISILAICRAVRIRLKDLFSSILIRLKELPNPSYFRKINLKVIRLKGMVKIRVAEWD